jgi:hypothetical protein
MDNAMVWASARGGFEADVQTVQGDVSQRHHLRRIQEDAIAEGLQKSGEFYKDQTNGEVRQKQIT